MVLYDILQIAFTKFKYDVLRCFTIFTPRVVNFEHSHNIFAIFKLVEDLVFARNVLTCLLGPFYSDSLL